MLRSLKHISHLETLFAGSQSKTMPSVIRVALRGGRSVKILKIQVRLARLSNGLTMDRDVVGAINIGLRYLSTDGRGIAFLSTEPHGVRAKLSTPHRGPNPLTEKKHREEETLLIGC